MGNAASSAACCSSSARHPAVDRRLRSEHIKRLAADIKEHQALTHKVDSCDLPQDDARAFLGAAAHAAPTSPTSPAQALHFVTVGEEAWQQSATPESTAIHGTLLGLDGTDIGEMTLEKQAKAAVLEMKFVQQRPKKQDRDLEKMLM